MNFVCDSSSLISLVETCNLGTLSFLQKKKNARFLVPPAVVYEIVENPSHVNRHAFSALRLKKALSQGILAKYNSASLQKNTKELLVHANNLFSVNGKTLKILHPGEAECLAAYRETEAKAFIVDEKTTRLLLESPKLLLESLRNEYGGPVKVNGNTLEKLRRLLDGFVALRSTEIVGVAFQNGFFVDFGKDEQDAFHSVVYALREAGCSITSKELLDYQGIIKG
ncbi:hypothetical protein HZC09_03875 [Candidatus Micrarchaeota archaeon]|nr:hypothetical protein [Candidatus Micrarchaeota archaeon]